jgi:hypothetical protein
MMKQILIPAVALAMIIVGGYQHRVQSELEDRKAQQIEEAAKNLPHAVPLKIGDWLGEDQPIDDREMRAAEIVGCISRTFTHQLTGEVRQMILVCGSPGPISVHTPDVCFQSQGYVMISEPKRLELEIAKDRSAVFWWADFQQDQGVFKRTLRTFWSWKGLDSWRAVDHPRLQFAACPVLNKLYVACPLTGLEEPGSIEPGGHFLKSLITTLEQSDGADLEISHNETK